MSTLVIQARVHYFNCSHQSCGAINTKQRATANIIDSFVFPRWEKSTRWWTGWMRCLSSFILSFAIFNFNPSFLVLSRFNVTIQISSLIYHIYIYMQLFIFNIQIVNFLSRNSDFPILNVKGRSKPNKQQSYCWATVRGTKRTIQVKFIRKI